MAAQESQAAVSQAKADILKMAAAGVGDEVLLAYIRSAKEPIRLTADDIITLKNDKVGPPLIEAILNHDSPAPASVLASPSTSSAPALNQAPPGPARAFGRDCSRGPRPRL